MNEPNPILFHYREDDGEKEEKDGEDETVAVDVRYGAGVDNGRRQEPREGQPDQNVENVGTDRIGYRHVALACQPQIPTS